MCAKRKIVTTFRCHLVFDVLFYQRKDCPLEGDSEATINALSSQKCLDTLKNTFVERSTQCTSFSTRKQPANAGSESKQFTENASEVLQKIILTHAQTKCPPVRPLYLAQYKFLRVPCKCCINTLLYINDISGTQT